MAIATAPQAQDEALPPNNPAPQEIISERYRGLMVKIGYWDGEGRTRHEQASKLSLRLSRDLEDLTYGLLQHDLESHAESIVEKLGAIIRREAIRLVVEDGSACWDDPEHARAFEEMMQRRWGSKRAAGAS